MRGMKGSLLMVAMAAAIMENDAAQKRRWLEPNDSTPIKRPSQIKSPYPKNFRKWVINGKEVWAATKKAAYKKYEKLP